ncbi:uncharacterized protein LOC127001970 [Eriocheir sinensis]|uniref:uncharacterized protein LOC127001970 n=1 Tax=Eriocheir sinensis TaxID=95602 RepID=UPI0021C675AB|nr:uncharacterized protein LOC127001970 [Eriocheir sinensis]
MNAGSSSPLPRPLLLLLLASALAVLGETLNSTLPASCPAENTDPEADWIFKYRKSINRRLESTTYLHPEQGFHGVGLMRGMFGKQYIAWFPLPDTCFPDDTVVWWKMEFEAQWIQDTEGQGNTLQLQLKTGTCNAQCVQAVPNISSSEHIYLYALGPYSLTYTEPDKENCTTMVEMKEDLHDIDCTAPGDPYTILAPAPTPAPGPASYAGAVGVGVLVLVLVLVCVVLAGVLLAMVVVVMQTLKQIDKKTQG